MVAVVSGLAGGVGLVMPLRWGVLGFLGAALVLYLGMFSFLSLRGLEGLPLSESLLLFEGGIAAYLGCNLLVAYRALALPALILGPCAVFRQAHTAKPSAHQRQSNAGPLMLLVRTRLR